MNAQTEETVVYLDPRVILADDNARFGLKRIQIEKLAEDIAAHGGVHTPVEVEELNEETAEGQTHRLTVGHYRHAAATYLNDTQAAGLLLPALVRPSTTGLGRLRRQLSENIERESMSPMDMAVAIRKLTDSGVPKGEIRALFARPTGKKGLTFQPASNAWVNITLGFLKLSKAVQDKIHDGRIGYGAAYELGRVSPEKQAAVLERAEADRLALMEQDETDEEKFLAAEAKLAEKNAERERVLTEAEQAKADLAAAEAALESTKAAVKAAMGMVPKNLAKLPAKEQRVIGKQVEATKAALKAAQADVAKVEKAATKVLAKASTLTEATASAKKKLDAAKKAKGVVKGKKVGAEDVRKASVKLGAAAGGGPVPLKAADMRAVVKEMATIAAYPTVMAIAEALRACFDGVTTTSQMVRAVATIVKEPNVPKEKAKK